MDFQTAAYCEIDRCASAAYAAVHGVSESLNAGDITAVDADALPDMNVIVGGSPCQDFSVAGHRKGALWTCRSCGFGYNPLTVHWSRRGQCPVCGGTAIERTRSSLIVEWLRIVRAKRPRFALYENVPGLTGQPMRPVFDLFVRELEEYGYSVCWKVLNALDCGVPQNRARVYCVIIRKDLDSGGFRFPEPVQLERFLCDLMAPEAPEKYWLPQDRVETLVQTAGPRVLTAGADGARHPQEGPFSIRAVRKLMPEESWQVMGFTAEDCRKARDAMLREDCTGRGGTETHLYRQAGNSIAVDVLLRILQNLQATMPGLFEGVSLGSFFSGIGAFERALSRLEEELPGRPQTEPVKLRYLGYEGNSPGIGNRVYDCLAARTQMALGGGGGAKTGWYAVPEKAVPV